jgi:hypothetical protein
MENVMSMGLQYILTFKICEDDMDTQVFSCGLYP